MPATDLRLIADSQLAAFHRCAAIAFQEPLDDDMLARFARLEELDRSWAAFEGDEIVGTSTAYSLMLSVPGGEQACAGISWLTVLPTHRRRGILRELLGRQFADARERGEPLAALWAAGGEIYGRFGFGAAVMGHDYRIALGGTLPRQAPQPDVEPRLRLEPPLTSLDLLAPMYAAIRGERPGMPSRSSAWWATRMLADQERRLVVARDPAGDPCGYALYRTHGLPPEVIVELIELIAADHHTNATLWRLLCGLELARELRAPHRPVDDPLPLLFDDIRRAQVTGCRDCLWLRLLDVPRALAQRHWASHASVTLYVRDSTLTANDGLWRLETTAAGPGTCERPPTGTEPDLVLDVRELGSAFLGGIALSRLAAAGRVDERTRGTVAALDGALGVARAPWAPEHF
jgi:predicted acetyltransferase